MIHELQDLTLRDARVSQQKHVDVSNEKKERKEKKTEDRRARARTCMVIRADIFTYTESRRKTDRRTDEDDCGDRLVFRESSVGLLAQERERKKPES